MTADKLIDALIEAVHHSPLDEARAARQAVKAHFVALSLENQRLREAQLTPHRLNVEDTNEGVRVCRGLHEKATGCEWEYFTRVAQ